MSSRAAPVRGESSNNLVASIASRFDRAVESGGNWSALCPAHDDRHASLSISAQSKTPGAAMIVCGAGCNAATILAQVGLELADLYPDVTRRGPSAHILRQFNYHDESGRVLYGVRRLDTDRGARSKFVYVHPTPDGWAKGAGTDERVLFNLLSLLSNPDMPLIVTEGERDAESLANIGFLTTTVASGNWTGIDLAVFRDRGVLVMIDNDRVGFDKGRKVVDLLHSAGAALVSVVRPPDAHKDATAAIAAGCAWAEFVQNVNLHCDSPPVETWEPPPEPKRDPFPTHTEAGKPFWATMPTTVLVDKSLTALSVRIYGLLDIKAGTNGKAKITHTELAEALGRSVKNTDPIANSINELVKHGWVENFKRGWYLINNPVRTTKSPFFPQDPKHPSELTRIGEFRNTNVGVQQNRNSHEHGSSERASDLRASAQ